MTQPVLQLGTFGDVGPPQPVLQLGTFGDVGPPQPPAAPPPQPVLQLGQIDVPAPPEQTSRAPVNYGKAPTGTLALNLPQAETATLGNIEEKKDITAEEGRASVKAQEDISKLHQQDAAEKQQQAADYQTFLKDSMAEQQADHDRMHSDYKAYMQAAGNLKDPAKEFWADKSTGARVLSGLAAFASGLGAGLMGQTGNPYLEHLNKMIDANWQAHRQNVSDLFQRQVQAGKIADTDQSYRQFMDKAKQASYTLASAHIASELERVKQSALGDNYKVVADKTINDLNQQEIDRRAAEGQRQAAVAAAAAAANRAKQKEIADKYEAAYKESLGAGYNPDDARTHAAKLVQGAGYDRSLLAPIMEANGGQYNPKSGQFEFAPGEKKETDDLVPTVDPVTGKALKPEEREKLNALKVTLPDGSVRLANNMDDQKHVQQSVAASQKVQEFRNALVGYVQRMKAGKLDNADIEEWKGRRQTAIDSFKGATGAEGLTGKGMATMLGEEAFPEPPWKITNAVPGVARLEGNYAGYEGAIRSLDAFQKENTDALGARLRPARAGTAQPAAQPTAAPATGADFFKKFGGK